MSILTAISTATLFEIANSLLINHYILNILKTEKLMRLINILFEIRRIFKPN
jgi:hypothetical protein